MANRSAESGSGSEPSNVATTAVESDSDSGSESDHDELRHLEIEELLGEESDGGGYTDDSEDEDTGPFQGNVNLCETDIDNIMSMIFGEDDSEEELV